MIKHRERARKCPGVLQNKTMSAKQRLEVTRQNEPKCLIFKLVPLDFSGFQGCQDTKTVDNTITPSELKAHSLPFFRHIHSLKAASRHRPELADLTEMVDMSQCPLSRR
jgi:hypothetical protein